MISKLLFYLLPRLSLTISSTFHPTSSFGAPQPVCSVEQYKTTTKNTKPIKNIYAYKSWFSFFFSDESRTSRVRHIHIYMYNVYICNTRFPYCPRLSLASTIYIRCFHTQCECDIQNDNHNHVPILFGRLTFTYHSHRRHCTHAFV